MAQAGFVVASFSVLQCFVPDWNFLSCPVVSAGLFLATVNMLNTAEHCTATYERAQTNLNVCILENEAETDLGNTGGDDESSGDRESAVCGVTAGYQSKIAGKVFMVVMLEVGIVTICVLNGLIFEFI